MRYRRKKSAKLKEKGGEAQVKGESVIKAADCGEVEQEAVHRV
jgi:hypothetical protein